MDKNSFLRKLFSEAAPWSFNGQFKSQFTGSSFVFTTSPLTEIQGSFGYAAMGSSELTRINIGTAAYAGRNTNVAWQSSLIVSGDGRYLLHTSGSSLNVFDGTDLTEAASIALPFSAASISAEYPYLYIVSNAATYEFAVYDISNLPTAAQISIYSPTVAPSYSSITAKGNVSILAGSQQTAYIDITNKANPFEIRDKFHTDILKNPIIFGDYVYFYNGKTIIYVKWTLFSYNSFTVVDTSAYGGFIGQMRISGNYLIVLTDTNMFTMSINQTDGSLLFVDSITHPVGLSPNSFGLQYNKILYTSGTTSVVTTLSP